MKPAIIETALSQYVAEARDLIQAVNDAQALEMAYETKLAESREVAKARRIELGMYLRKVRDRLPARASNNDGWMAFLEAIEMPDTTAYRYMQEAVAVSGLTNPQSSKVGNSGPEDVPPPRDDDAPSSPARVSGEEAGDDQEPEPEVEIDRDTWCTPKWLTDAIGPWDLDPCANERSHVQASREFRLDERGEDGLFMASKVDAKHRVFINPPYSDVLPWIEAYAHTRFCFLLKFDPSTEWFATLMQHTKLVLFPRGTRVQFEAPEGVPADKAKANQFPHALFYARAEDATDAIRDVCFQPWRIK